VAGDVAMAGMAGSDVTQDLPVADDGVTPGVGVSIEPQASDRPAASEPLLADGSATAQHPPTAPTTAVPAESAASPGRVARLAAET
jgi:hypothetical protein